MNNTQQELLNFAAELTRYAKADRMRFAGLSDTDSESPLLVAKIAKDAATLYDAFVMQLAFHAGCDGPEFNPSTIECLDDFEAACEAKSAERAESEEPYDARREHSTLNFAQQGC